MALMLVSQLAFAISSPTLDFNGIARNTSTGALLNGTYPVNVTIYNQTGDVVLYSEQVNVFVRNGTFNYLAGKTVVLNPRIFRDVVTQSNVYARLKLGDQQFIGFNFSEHPYATVSRWSNDSIYFGAQLPTYYASQGSLLSLGNWSSDKSGLNNLSLTTVQGMVSSINNFSQVTNASLLITASQVSDFNQTVRPLANEANLSSRVYTDARIASMVNGSSGITSTQVNASIYYIVQVFNTTSFGQALGFPLGSSLPNLTLATVQGIVNSNGNYSAASLNNVSEAFVIAQASGANTSSRGHTDTQILTRQPTLSNSSNILVAGNAISYNGTANLNASIIASCIAITGSSALCDGDDNAGAGTYDWNYTTDFGTKGVITDSSVFNITINGSGAVRTHTITNGVMIEVVDTDTDTDTWNSTTDILNSVLGNGALYNNTNFTAQFTPNNNSLIDFILRTNASQTASEVGVTYTAGNELNLTGTTFGLNRPSLMDFLIGNKTLFAFNTTFIKNLIIGDGSFWTAANDSAALAPYPIGTSLPNITVGNGALFTKGNLSTNQVLLNGSTGSLAYLNASSTNLTKIATVNITYAPTASITYNGTHFCLGPC